MKIEIEVTEGQARLVEALLLEDLQTMSRSSKTPFGYERIKTLSEFLTMWNYVVVKFR